MVKMIVGPGGTPLVVDADGTILWYAMPRKFTQGWVWISCWEWEV